MLISTKGRYALRVIVDIAEHSGGEPVAVKEIVERQDMSQKYIERIMSLLSKGGVVEAVHGKRGGYRLCRDARECTVGEVLRAAEGSVAPVSCPECIGAGCSRAAGCRTLPVWKRLDDMIEGYLDSVTVFELINGGGEGRKCL